MIATTRAISIERALRDKQLLGAALGELSTWSAWVATLKAAFGLPLGEREAQAFASVSGGRPAPVRPVRELWAIAGRRSGKSRMAAAVGAFLGACIDHSAKLAPGEVGMVLVLAPTTSQAQIVFSYLQAFIENSPVLRGLVQGVTADEVRLKGGVVIAVHPASFRTIRGRTLLACVFDESAYWRDETSASPDIEVYRAVMPALATTKGLLVGIGTPYRKLGLLFTKYRDCFGKDDAGVLVVQGPTPTFNPSIDTNIISQAERDDPAAALSEWRAQFRTDLSSFLDDASIDAAIVHGRPLELPRQKGVHYLAFADASAGRHDQFTIAVAHKVGDKIVADLVRGRKPPFDPGSVAEEYAALARSYGCSSVTGDNYAAEWVAAAFRGAGINYLQSELTRSELYLEGLPIFTRGLIEIPDSPQLVRELRLLERRVARSGKDLVDHGAGGSDDHANALFGAIYLASGPAPMRISQEMVAAIMRAPPARQCAPGGFQLGERRMAQQRRGRF